MTTKIILYNNWNERFNGLPEILPQLIQRLTEELEKVPAELHDETYFEITSEPKSMSVDVNIYYVREETPEEQDKREAQVALGRKAREDRLRLEYERLKKQFEP